MYRSEELLKPLLIIMTFIISTSLPFSPLLGQTGEELYLQEPYWQQHVDYDIDVTLDTQNQILSGRQTITYRNNSPDTLEIFYLHLYPNAYREKTSSLIRGFMRDTAYFLIGLPESRRGWIDIGQFKVNGSDADFEVKGTILSSQFSRTLPPGGEATIEIEFTEKIRRRIGRAGYMGRHYDLAQWYPKMVVYDKLGWHPDQFEMGEFYGEFGTFDVRITLPRDYVVAATGVCLSGDPGWDRNRGGRPGGGKGSREEEKGNKTLHFRAEKVHDFAWSADPTFVVEDTTFHGYDIRSFYRHWNKSWKDSVLARTIRTMKWLEDFAGPYPYPHISVVDCPTHGGMEYPMLVMNGSAREALIVHEVGHNYFYGILANNERDEAWMDEGFTQYQTFRFAEKRYGPYGRKREPGLLSSLYDQPALWEGLARSAIRLHRTGWAERVAKPYQDFESSGNTMVYVKAPLFLRALHHLTGDDVFSEIIHTYFDRWKFKHVDEKAFLDVCEEISGLELDEFFKQWLHTTKNCDYELEDMEVKETEAGAYRTSVNIKRKGEMKVPLTLSFRMKNGNTETRQLDGLLRDIDEEFIFSDRPVSASINPDNEMLDIYHRDNFLPRRWDFKPDVPFESYRPGDAYQFRILPIGFYNDIDGGKAGLRVRGSYQRRYFDFTLQSLYSFESGELDYYGSFRHPLKYFGRDANVAAEGFYREGRAGGTLRIDKKRRESLQDPWAQEFSLWAAYHEVTDTSYVFPYTYEKGINLKSGLHFSIRPRTDVFSTNLAINLERSLWGSDFNFEKSTFQLRLWPARRFPFPLKPYLRLFLGYSSISPPLQERFNLAGAGVLTKESYFWLRSPGAFPKDYYVHFHVPGDANLRGYFDGDFSFKRIFASNNELALPFPLPVGRGLSRMLDPKLFLFYDVGVVLDEQPLEALPPGMRPGFDDSIFDEALSDFGVGIKLWKITAEFPIYISHPELTGYVDNWNFRATVGFTGLF